MPGRPATLTTGAKPERTLGGLGAWLVLAVVVVVAASLPAPFPQAARYTILALILYLALASGDRLANPINNLARSLGG